MLVEFKEIITGTGDRNMTCKLCGTEFTTSQCTRCGLKPGENPIVWPIRTGEYAGWDIDRVFKINPGYLKGMLQQGVGTGAQRALIRLLLEQPAAPPPPQPSTIRSQDAAFRVWLFMAAISFVAIIALIIIR